jgi:hypothetical protein
MAEASEAEWRAACDQYLKWLTDSLGISDILLRSLSSDDDWTFVIKLHGILEAGLNHLLLTHLDNPRLNKIVAKLETSNPQIGKIAFIKAYDLLPDEAIKFIQLFSEIRNRAVHDIKNFNLDLMEHTKTLDEKQLKNWTKALASGLFPTTKIDGVDVPSTEVVKDNPRYGIFCSCLAITARVLQHQVLTERNRKIRDDFYGLGVLAFEHYGFSAPSLTTPKK